jgi:hypothetical protein
MSFHDLEIVTRFSCDIFWCLLHNFLMRFPYENLCLLQCNFCMRFSFEILCFLLHNFLVRFLGWFHAFFLTFMRFPYEIYAFLPLWNVMRFPYETSCFVSRYVRELMLFWLEGRVQSEVRVGELCNVMMVERTFPKSPPWLIVSRYVSLRMTERVTWPWYCDSRFRLVVWVGSGDVM